jgi:hypothetical protein
MSHQHRTKNRPRQANRLPLQLRHRLIATGNPQSERADDMSEKPLRGDRNQCAACGNYFNSTAAFDKHRVGEFGKDRGCMGWFEMAHVGMHYGADGFWRGSKMPAALLDKVAA